MASDLSWKSVPIIDVSALRQDFGSPEGINQGSLFAEAAAIVGFVCSNMMVIITKLFYIRF